MRIAILGATSQIAKDLILSFSASGEHELILLARRPETLIAWLKNTGIKKGYSVSEYSFLNVNENFQAIINFVGVGNPATTLAIGASIFDITQRYDALALEYVKHHPECRYIFLSSGAAYGSNFDKAASEEMPALIDINHLQAQNWYGVAKLYAECTHRALANLPIVDIRVFNYFSHTQDMAAKYFVNDIVRAIREKSLLRTSSNSFIRDYVTPYDFHQLVSKILNSKARNDVVDCYSQEPVKKFTLLDTMKKEFGLRYESASGPVGLNATGAKPHYYSLNRRALDFGYQPSLTSLDGVLKEMNLVFQI
jgi:nucleoside-diphosphate-sugar epimerase